MRVNSEYISVIELCNRWQVDRADIMKLENENIVRIIHESCLGREDEECIPCDKLEWLDVYYCKRTAIELYEKTHPHLIKPTIKMSLQGILPPYLDPNNKYFSKELQVAVEAWKALFDKGGTYNKRLAPKVQIQKWLKKHYGDLTDHARTRITTVINPRKQGGAPPTMPE